MRLVVLVSTTLALVVVENLDVGNTNDCGKYAEDHVGRALLRVPAVRRVSPSSRASIHY